MTAIAPNTTVWLVNTLLTSGSEDTYYFASLADQTAYFEARKLIGLTNYTYQREQRHFIKVGVNGSDMARVIKNANYMMWKNSSYEDKNYYAFITEAEWINNEVVKLYFEMDYIQTYLFNMILPQCFIARQHAEVDGIGDNIQPEPVELGEYLYDEAWRCKPDYFGFLRDESCTVVAEICNDQTQASMVDGVFTAVKYTVFRNSPAGLQAAQALINQHKSDTDWILAVYSTKYMYLGIDPSNTPVTLLSSDEPVQYVIPISSITDDYEIDGYLPKNKKLYTYPYTFHNITNCKGSDINLRYEFWDKVTGTNSHEVIMLSTRGLPVTVQIRPKNYKGEKDDPAVHPRPDFTTQGISSDTFLELNSFPQGSWSIDSYQLWATQNQANITGGIIKTAGTAAVASLANPVAGAVAGVSGLFNTMVDTVSGAYKSSIEADKFSGSIAGSAVQFNTPIDVPVERRVHLSYEYARTIDNFFTMYGYTQNKIGTPNIHARTRFTYIRTVGFAPIGNIPQDARKFISSRFDNGIRFWVDHESGAFCNYSAPNNTLS